MLEKLFASAKEPSSALQLSLFAQSENPVALFCPAVCGAVNPVLALIPGLGDTDGDSLELFEGLIDEDGLYDGEYPGPSV